MKEQIRKYIDWRYCRSVKTEDGPLPGSEEAKLKWPNGFVLLQPSLPISDGKGNLNFTQSKSITEIPGLILPGSIATPKSLVTSAIMRVDDQDFEIIIYQGGSRDIAYAPMELLHVLKH